MQPKTRFFDSLKFRIALPLWILVAVIVGGGVYQGNVKREQNAQNLSLSSFDVPLLASTSELAAHVNATYLAERSMLTLNVKSEEYATTKAAHTAALVAAAEKAAVIVQKLAGDEKHVMMSDIQEQLQAWTDTTREVFTLRDRDTRMDRLLAIDLSGGDSGTQFNALIERIDTFNTDWIESLQHDAQTAALATGTSIRNSNILSIVSALFGIVVAIMLPMWLVSRLRNIRQRIDEICDGDGDLGRRLAVRYRDEISDISHAFNRFSGQLDEAMQQTANAAEVVAADAREMARHNVMLSQQTEAQVTNIREASTSLEEISNAICSTSQNAGQASNDARATSDSATNGKTGIERTIDAMRKLSDSSQQIIAITGVVEAIAFQTNILALNAAVEAARAGEQGRGFAVVATEVRGLAKRSTDAANDIKRLIDTASEGIEHSTRLANESGTTLDDILASATGVADTISQISDSSNGQNQRVQEINVSITHLRDSMGSTTEFVDKMAVTSKRLESQSAELMQVVDRYRSQEHTAND